MNPKLDPRLTPEERWLYGDLYTAIDKAESRFNVDLTLLIAENMVRRAVSRGADILDLVSELHAAAVHQNEYNRNHGRQTH